MLADVSPFTRSEMSTGRPESADAGFYSAFQRLNVESDDDDSMTSDDVGVSGDPVCRGLFETARSDGEQAEYELEQSGDEDEQDAEEGSQSSSDFMQSPRAEDGEDSYASNRVWNLLMRASSPLQPDDSVYLPRLLLDSDSDSDSDRTYDSESIAGELRNPVSNSPRAIESPTLDSGVPSPLSSHGEQPDPSGHMHFNFRAADLFSSGADRAARLIAGLEVVSGEWLNQYKNLQGGSEDAVICAICLQSLHDTQNLEGAARVNALPCRHLFHTDCLAPWFATKTTCPTCRSDLAPDDPVAPSAGRVVFSQAEMTRLLLMLAHGHLPNTTTTSPVHARSNDGSEDWDDMPDLVPAPLEGSPSPIPPSTSPTSSSRPTQAPQTLLTPINSRAQTMDLPSEQLPFDQIRWPPGRSASIESGPLHPVADTNPRMFPELLRNWLLRRSHEAANPSSPQLSLSPDQLEPINLSPPRVPAELNPPLHQPAGTPDSSSMAPSPTHWDNSHLSPWVQSIRHTPLLAGTILELPHRPESHSPWISPSMIQPSESESPHLFGALSMDSSFVNSSEGSEARHFFDFSLSEAVSRQSPITAPISARSSPPIHHTHPTSYAALSQAMQRMRGQAFRESHQVSDTFTFGEPSSDTDDAVSQDMTPDSSKWSHPPSINRQSPAEEPHGSHTRNTIQPHSSADFDS